MVDPRVQQQVGQLHMMIAQNKQISTRVENNIRQVTERFTDFAKENIDMGNSFERQIEDLIREIDTMKEKVIQVVREVKRLKAALEFYGTNENIMELDAVMGLIDPANILSTADVERITLKVVNEIKDMEKIREELESEDLKIEKEEEIEIGQAESIEGVEQERRRR